MSWPLTGNALSRFNNLMSDLRQYGDFPFVGSPDDITILWQTIKEVSGGVLNPPLDDVANRSHYWTLRLVEYLGGQITPCPPCPPCPPTTQTGMQWGPDVTQIDFSDSDVFFEDTIIDNSSVSSVSFPSLITITDGGNFNTFNLSPTNTSVSYSFPELMTVTAGSFDGTSNSTITSWSSPKLTTINGDFLLYSNPLIFLDLSELQVVNGTLDVVENIPITSASYPSLTMVDNYFYCAASCPNLTSVTAPLLQSVGTSGGILYVYDCPLLPSVSFPALTDSGDGVWIYENDIITSISLPNLVTTAEVQIFDSPQLTTIDLSSFVPTDGSTINCSGNALTAATVNHILRRAAANAGYVSGIIQLDLGTNAAPTGQGIVDKNDLIARGVNVTTN